MSEPIFTDAPRGTSMGGAAPKNLEITHVQPGGDYPTIAEVETFFKKARIRFERVDDRALLRQLESLLTSLGFVNHRAVAVNELNEHQLYFSFPADAPTSFEGILVDQWFPGQNSFDEDYLGVSLLVGGREKADKQKYVKDDPEKSPYWAKFQEVVAAIRNLGIANFVAPEMDA